MGRGGHRGGQQWGEGGRGAGNGVGRVGVGGTFPYFKNRKRAERSPSINYPNMSPGQRLSGIENVHKICVATSSKKSHFSAISYSKGYARAKLKPRMPSLKTVSQNFLDL